MLLTGTAAERVSAGLMLGCVLYTLAILLGGAARAANPRRNPKPRHLGDVIARWKKRGPVLAKRKDALRVALDRLERAIDDHSYPRTHAVVAQKKRIEQTWRRALHAFHDEAERYNNALHEAEAKYDQDPGRSWRPIKKNPKGPQHLGAKLAQSKARIAKIQKQRLARWQAIERIERLNLPPKGWGKMSGDPKNAHFRHAKLLEADKRLFAAGFRERDRARAAVAEAEDKYDAARAHRPIKKNPYRRLAA